MTGACAACSLPPVGIKPVARWDKATTTFLLSSFLNSMGVGWTLGVAKGLPWPPCVHRVKGVNDVLSYLNSTEYATGYAVPKMHAIARASRLQTISGLCSMQACEAC